MKIVVIGGSGLIGKKLVAILRSKGHEVLPASPSSGVNSVTGAGLAEALHGTTVVVDVSNSPSFDDEIVMNFFTASTRNLVTAERAAQVRHHVALSVVGADRLPDSGYMRAKVAQESLIRASGVPFTIVRATQFFEFLGAIAESEAGDTLRLPQAPMQPIAADDVAKALAHFALSEPANGIVEIAGPASLPIAEFIRQLLSATGSAKKVIADPQAKYFGAALDEQGLNPGKDPWLGSTSFREWLLHHT